MDTTPTEAAQVVALLEVGHGQREVARRLHLSRSKVQRVYRRYLETGAFVRRPGTGRPRATTERDDRFIATNSLRDRGLNAVQLQQALRDVRGVAISRWTVRRRLKERNLTSHKPATGPKLTVAHRRSRLEFAREHINWTLEDWRSVLFSDESRICLFSNDGRNRVYRRPGERFAQCCIRETVSFGGGSCMVWGGISLDGKTELVFVDPANDGNGRRGLTADRYITDILENHVMPYAGFVGENFLFMHDCFGRTLSDTNWDSSRTMPARHCRPVHSQTTMKKTLLDKITLFILQVSTKTFGDRLCLFDTTLALLYEPLASVPTQ